MTVVIFFKVTDKFVKSLYEAQAHVIVVITIRKIRTFVYLLKAKLPLFSFKKRLF